MPFNDIESQQVITNANAKSILVSHMLSGNLGPVLGKAVNYSRLTMDSQSISFLAALVGDDDNGNPVDRYRVTIDRHSGDVTSSELVSLSSDELAEAVLSASGHHLSTFSRFVDGSFSVSYKVSVKEDPEIEYIVQLRHYGDVASMNAVMQLVSSIASPHILPVPAVYPISNEEEHQKSRGSGLQITRFIRGTKADVVYPSLNHEQKLAFVRRLALAFDALWSIPLPQERLIGELKVARKNNEQFIISVGPDRYNSLGGPFTSIADYLRALIRVKLRKFEEQNGIEEYKYKYLSRVTAFVNTGMHNVPVVVEQIPVVVLHLDMALHNILVSNADPTCVETVIDWEFCASAPYASMHRVIETFFHLPERRGFGPEIHRAQELRRAFWGAIPKWEAWNKSEATRVFLEWYRFGMFMSAQWKPGDLGKEDRETYWTENEQVVEEFLAKYHEQ